MTTRSYAITPDKLAAVAAKLKSHGFAFDPTQTSSTAEARGFHLQWMLKPKQIDITLTQHPFGEEGFFWRAVEDELGPCL